MPLKQPPDLGLEPLTARGPRRQPPAGPLVMPGPGHLQRPAADSARDLIPGPPGSDEGRHLHRIPPESATQRTRLRLRTSHRIRSSAHSLRSRASSARSSALSSPPPASRRRRSAPTQFPSVPSLTPSSRATCAIGLPVSRTSRTAPSLKSWSNFLRVSAIAPPHLRRCVHATRGNPLHHVGVVALVAAGVFGMAVSPALSGEVRDGLLAADHG